MKPGQKVGRKAPCPCGSGVLYKSCCYAKESATLARIRVTGTDGYNGN